jgi:hypothetical protein
MPFVAALWIDSYLVTSSFWFCYLAMNDWTDYEQFILNIPLVPRLQAPSKSLKSRNLDNLGVEPMT